MSKTTKEKFIIWQKYVVPFSSENEVEFPGFDGYKPQEEEDEQIPYEDTDIRIVDMDEMMEESFNKRQAKRMLFTPFGVIPLTDFNNLSKIFDFWVGHTNFNITQKVIHIISRIDGVESLDPMTRYRFRISVGKAYNSAEVKAEIQDKLDCIVKPNTIIPQAKY